MKIILMTITCFILTHAACSAGPATIESTAVQKEVTVLPVETDQALDPIEQAVVKQLATNLGLKDSDIALVHDEEIQFTDSCLGVTVEDVMCKQEITPGRIIIIKAQDVEYEYHTTKDGTRIQPATITLTWKREGGIEGFCDHMTVYLSGEVHRSSCTGGQHAEERLIDLLSTEELAQLNDWVMAYGKINIDASDPEGVSDRMIVALMFSGIGSEQTIAASDRQALLDFAQDLYQRFSR